MTLHRRGRGVHRCVRPARTPLPPVHSAVSLTPGGGVRPAPPPAHRTTSRLYLFPALVTFARVTIIVVIRTYSIKILSLEIVTFILSLLKNSCFAFILFCIFLYWNYVFNEIRSSFMCCNFFIILFEN